MKILKKVLLYSAVLGVVVFSLTLTTGAKENWTVRTYYNEELGMLVSVNSNPDFMPSYDEETGLFVIDQYTESGPGDGYTVSTSKVSIIPEKIAYAIREQGPDFMLSYDEDGYFIVTEEVGAILEKIPYAIRERDNEKKYPNTDYPDYPEDN